MDEFYLVSIIVGIFLLGCGYLIKVKKKLGLIAGYSPENVADEDGLAGWVGSNVIFIAVVILLTALLRYLQLLAGLPLYATCALIILADLIVTVAGSRKYMRNHNGRDVGREPQLQADYFTPPRALDDIKTIPISAERPESAALPVEPSREQHPGS